MRYRIEIRPAAVKDLQALPRKVLRQIDAKILALEEDPRPPGSKKLEGADDLWRIRSGDYRVIYQVRDTVLIVLVVRVRHRKDVYRGL